jgi:hypothetical protein
MATATDSQPRIGESAGAAFDAVAHGLPAPDRGNFDYEGTAVLALWRAQRVALLAEGASNTALADKGLTCISWLPIQEQQGAVISLLRQHLA